MVEKLVYDNVWEAIFENDPERVKDYEILSDLAIKYIDDVQLHFGDRESYRQLKKDSLELQALNEAGVNNWEGYSDAMDILEEYNS